MPCEENVQVAAQGVHVWAQCLCVCVPNGCSSMLPLIHNLGPVAGAHLLYEPSELCRINLVPLQAQPEGLQALGALQWHRRQQCLGTSHTQLVVAQVDLSGAGACRAAADGRQQKPVPVGSSCPPALLSCM